MKINEIVRYAGHIAPFDLTDAWDNVGLLAGTNDFSCLERGEGGREINRHNFTEAEIAERVRAPFLRRIFALMRLRNASEAFNGEFSVRQGRSPAELVLRWDKGGDFAELTADFEKKTIEVRVPSGVLELDG